MCNARNDILEKTFTILNKTSVSISATEKKALENKGIKKVINPVMHINAITPTKGTTIKFDKNEIR